jgi:amino acid adenylation domain-containing protein
MSETRMNGVHMTAEERALIDSILRKEGVAPPKADSILPRGDHGPAPLSFAQQRLWFFDQFEPGNLVYNLITKVLFEGDLNVQALERAFSEIVRRHEALRTTFDFKEGQPVQIVMPDQPIRINLIDLTHLPEEAQQARTEDIFLAEARRPFDLKCGPLLRTTLLQLREDKHLLLLAVHHIVSDEWSVGVLVHELGELYTALAAGRTPSLSALPIQYADFAVWQRQWLQGAFLEQQLEYWRKQLAGSSPVLELPADRPRPALQTFNGARISFWVPRDLTEPLKALTRSEKATLFMSLLAVFKVLLHRYTVQDDIVVGTPIANRQRQEIENLIGFFTNTLALRTDLSGNPGFRELLKRVRETALDAYAHQDLPFEYLVEKLHPQRTLSHSPLVQVMFVIVNAPETEVKFPNVKITPLNTEFSTAKFDLTFYVYDQGEEIAGAIEYNTDLFNPDRIDSMATHFCTVLRSIVANPDSPISDQALLSEKENHQILFEWNDAPVAFPRRCAHQLFEQQVERTPGALAAVFEREQLNYDELNRRANRVAHYLQSLGAAPGRIVGVAVERSMDMLIGVLGILKTGAACLPLDHSYPQDRLAFMLENSDALAVLTQAHLAANLPPTQAHVVQLDADRERIDQERDDNLPATANPQNAVYVIYTSGSTGRPKAVLLPHSALINLVEWHRATNSQSASVLQFASLIFDVSFQEIFSTLGLGGTLVLVPEHVRTDIRALGRLIEQHRVERFHLPVIVLQKLAEEFCEEPRPLLSLREFMVGGEQLQITPSMVKLFSRLKDCALYNHYGPSETHVVTSFPLPDDPKTWPSLPPLGRPIANSQMYVLDRHLHPAPVGVPGELYIAGDCLAHGYLKQPALTAERFLPNPFNIRPGARMYKTGDLVRYLPDKNIEFLGRNDFQVKIRGMRIELGEIEVELSRQAKVQDAVVTVRQEGPEKRLAAYIVPQPGEQLSPKELRAFLKERLPEHMVPAYIVVFDKFPLTPSGKIDRLSLPDPSNDSGLEPDYAAPQTAVEKVLAGIFADVLGRQNIGATDNFFDLGGHSLLATQLASRIIEAFQIELPVRKVFEEPTVTGLARSILEGSAERHRIERTAELLVELSGAKNQPGFAPDASLKPSNGSSTVPAIMPDGKPDQIFDKKVLRSAPLSFSQQRLWFLDQFEPQSPLYLLPSALRLKGPLNVKALEQSLNEIVRRHEALRTTFGMANDGPVQLVHEPRDWKMAFTDLQSLPEQEREGIAASLVRQEMETPIDLGQGPLFRTQVLRLAHDDHIVIVTMHHIVSDGWSMQVFIRELATLYDEFCAGRLPSLPALRLQYADFAARQRQWAQGPAFIQQLEYWKKQLAGISPALELPLDHPRPAHKTSNGAAIPFTLSQELSKEVVQVSRREGVTLFMTLLAAYSILLHRYTGQEDILVGTPIANRNRREIEELIGFFINNLVLRIKLSADSTFLEVLKAVREICLEAYSHQDVPFEKLVEELQPERSLSHSPLFQVVFHLQNVLTGELKLHELSVGMVDAPVTKAKFDLVLTMAEATEGLKGFLTYNTDLFEAETATRIATHFQKLLESAVFNPHSQIASLPMLTSSEQHHMLFTWNDLLQDYGKNQLVHEALEEQAERRPRAIALKFESTTVTYEELNQRANQLAHRLRILGVGPEVIVGICVPRGIEMMVGLLGIFKAGGAYLALDPDYPKARTTFMLQDSQAKVLITEEHLAQGFSDFTGHRVYLDTEKGSLSQESSENPAKAVSPANMAYLIYTSGSTGKPKGIMIEHGNLAHYLGWANEFMFDQTVEIVPAVQNLIFDGSLKQLFAPLVRGLAIWILGRDEVAEPVSLIRSLRDHKDLRLSVVPSLWKAMLDALESGQAELAPGTIRSAFVGGEELPKSVADRSFALMPELSFWNLYGPSEITATATAAQLKPGDQITIGHPIAGKKVYILNPHLQPAPIGVPGEVFIGRKGVARGYLGRPDLTAESFIPDPFSNEPGARLYRTRDRARYLADGRIDFLGRLDHQVKIRGFRIELGEIESALREHPAVKEAVAIVKSANDEKYIAAYVVPLSVPAPAVAELRAFLKLRLPEYMVPSTFVLLDQLPLTATGKLDRAGLPEPDRRHREREIAFTAPRNAVEETLVEIFAEVLGLEKVGIHDNFFDLGGHSLLATRVVSRIRKMFNAELPLRNFFESPTAAEIAEFLKSHEPVPGRMEEMMALMRKIESLSTDDLEELLRRKKAKETG